MTKNKLLNDLGYRTADGKKIKKIKDLPDFQGVEDDICYSPDDDVYTIIDMAESNPNPSKLKKFFDLYGIHIVDEEDYEKSFDNTPHQRKRK